MDIFYFQNNGVIERISVDKELKIFIETNDNKHYSIIFNNYREIYIRNEIFAETWESEIGEIELFREAKFEKSQVLAKLLIKNQWDEELIFYAYVGNYVIEEL
ncbi:MAG: hypothetical protein NC205_01800 [Prevotella sp.]|nr:hypothetical protein [Alistipes senegalensis]MCM1357301.1 hypothetical protein [Prevotella sp.]MCM1473556.1 hypothetical protein [Muribaculaceae bacterium]